MSNSQHYALSNFDYETKVESILRQTTESMSVRDIRIELTYRDNDFGPVEDYTLEDIETEIGEAVESLERKNRNDQIQGELSRDHVVYKISGLPAEIENTETRYNII